MSRSRKVPQWVREYGFKASQRALKSVCAQQHKQVTRYQVNDQVKVIRHFLLYPTVQFNRNMKIWIFTARKRN